MEKLRMTSPDLTEANIGKLADLFPAVVAETLDADGNPKRAIDFDLLRQELSDHIVEGPQERYQLDWPGKHAAAFAANAPIAKTLRPMREESVDFDTTKNLFIEGDNLDALKLLQESYLGKVKLIYIDPPYNTGNDFVYNDDFAERKSDYEERTGQRDGEGTRMVTNLLSNGRFHSDWLSMMYPRLKLARNLLKDDGVMVVSIDDDELPRMRMLLDEIFGPQNFYACVTWQKKYAPANDAKKFSDVHDYLLFYSRSSTFSRNLFPRTTENNKPYKHDDADGRGPYRTGDLSVRTYSAANDYSIKNPVTGESFAPPAGRCWMSSREKVSELIAENRVYWGSDGQGAPQLKRYLSEVQQGTVPITLWSYDFAGHTDQARKEIKTLFGTTAVFDTPKPTRLLRRVLEVSTSRGEEDIVLDFFAGSATTAHAVMLQNSKDGGSRRFIMVQLDEKVRRETGFDTISAMARQRIVLAGTALAERTSETARDFDGGFRALRVDSTSMSDILRSADETGQLGLSKLEASIKPDRTGEDLLFQVLLDWGLELTMTIAVEQIDGREVFVVEDGALIACFDEQVSQQLVREIAKRQPLRAVFRDSGFDSDDARINAEQIFLEVSPSSDVKVI